MKALQYLKEKYESENNVQYFAEPDLPMTTSLERICKYMQEYAESHTAAHTAALQERVKELEENLAYAIRAIKAVNSFGATRAIIDDLEKALKK